MRVALPFFAFSFAMCSALATPLPDDHLQMGNPASSNCAAQHNGSLFIATDSKTGGQYGICHLSPTLAVEEWCLYRNDMGVEKKDCPNLILLLKDKDK